MMIRSTLSALVMTICAGNLCYLSMAQANPSGQASVNVPATALKYSPTGISDGQHELYAAGAYGDMARGPHGTMVKAPAGFVSPNHIHTEDYWGVVVSGVVTNGLPNSADVPLHAGSVWFQKGGEEHVTKCTSPTECIFFIGQNGKFDEIMTKK